jgi:hypothetical protein
MKKFQKKDTPPPILKTIDFKPIRRPAAEPNLAALTADQKRTVSGSVFFT